MHSGLLKRSLICVALAALVVTLGLVPSDRAEGGPAGRPNIVLITTDDQSYESLRVMSRTRRVVGREGTDLRRYFASFPLCCPARATWITGQYAHNHGVTDNLARFGGGYPALRDPDRVLPVWLRSAGYETALVGKWLHDYHSTQNPPGWSRFHALLDGNFTRYYGYSVTDSLGGSESFGEADQDYVTDTLTDRFAIPYIAARAGEASPFFLHVSYTAPHWGRGRNDAAGRRCVTPEPFRFETARPKPAPRHAEAFRSEPLPRPPSFNERDVADKPPSVANRARMSAAAQRALAKRYRCELATLLAVDEGIARINGVLEATGIEDNTVVIFTTDNGYMHGEHRIRGGKVQPYEEAIRLPFLIKGPGIPAGRRSFALTGDVDLVPTLLDFAGVGAPSPAEGRPLDGISVRAALQRERSSDRAILLEAKRPAHASPDGGFAARSWVGVRTRRYTYIEHRSASVASAEQGNAVQVGAGRRVDRELYDNKLDPYQLESRHRSRRYAPTRQALADLLSKLEGCSGNGCVVHAQVPDPRRR